MSDYDALFERYLHDLRGAREEALAWWNDLFARELAIETDPTTARLRIDLRWPCGPASFPRVIGVVRQYYLECEALQVSDESGPEAEADPIDDANWGSEDQGEADQTWTEPRQLLIDHLRNVDDTLGEFMRFFVLLPVGRDEHGRTV